MSARDELVTLLTELMELTVLDEGNPQAFRARAYENAAQAVRGIAGDLRAMNESQLTKLDGIGKSTAKKEFREYFDTGTIAKLDTLREKYPAEFVALSRIPGLGPKTLLKLRAELDVHNLGDLKAALAAQRLRGLPGMGAKSEQKLAHAIERLGLAGKHQRTAIADALPIARTFIDALEALPEVTRIQYCGSLRRFRETIGDVDIVAASTAPDRVMEAFVSLPAVREIIVRGDTKTSVLTRGGLQVNLRVVTEEQFGAAVLYFTGSKTHNIKIRQRALNRGWTLNEYGLNDVESGDVIASRTEEEIYRALDLPLLPPPMREDSGEIEAAAAGELPELVRRDRLIGDLHVHTSLSGDGRSSLADIVAKAAEAGHQYLAITDHAENLAINGVDRDALRAQWLELAEVGEQYPELTLLRGCELNIGPDGDLDYDADFRRELDWCVAAVHSHFDLDQGAQTRRIVTAMEDPAVNVIGHLTGRMIGRRPGIELDIDAVLDAAAGTGTAIELNSALRRLDAAADVLRRGMTKGVTFVISTDAHHVDELDRMQWGVKQATRGWLDCSRVANTWPREQFLSWAKEKRRSA